MQGISTIDAALKRNNFSLVNVAKSEPRKTTREKETEYVRRGDENQTETQMMKTRAMGRKTKEDSYISKISES